VQRKKESIKKGVGIFTTIGHQQPMSGLLVSRLNRVRTSRKYLSCLLLVIIADWLFYGQKAGWTSGLFAALLLGASVMHTRPSAMNIQFKASAIAAFGLAISCIEMPNILSLILFLFTLSVMVFTAQKGEVTDVRMLARPMFRYCFAAWWRFISDALRLFRMRSRLAKSAKGNPDFLRHWLLPIGLVFLLLFMKANPIMHGWLKGADASFLKAFISTDRWFFGCLWRAYVGRIFARNSGAAKPKPNQS
jgi:hypothetical protein